MRILPDPKNAAQYVRMSTEHQQYSTANQKAAIAVYAAARGIEIVATYEDAGKSGLTFNGRPALRQLIADVVAGQDAFDTILVYDISRWGRFQDADESAHLEYLCRLAGVRIEYCAEPFSNDGTPFASICKVVKRALAAEYSRELSDKVFRGKHRLIELGFRQGGSPGIGLRRCLVDADGNRKGILAPGERKSIATDRVILVPGPPEEIAIVRRIYRDYVERGMGRVTIAAALNREGVRSESGRPWSGAVVKCVLFSEKYVGDSVWGRQSFKLQIARQHNAPETWARFEGAFEGIVSRTLFEKAQKVRAARANRITDDEVIARLRTIHRRYGRITARLIKKDRYISVAAIRNRFGSVITAYERAGYHQKRDLAFIAHNASAMRLRAAVAEAILEGFRSRDQQVERLSGACRFLINGEIVATVTVVKQRYSQRGNPRWLVKGSMGEDDIRVAVLMDGVSERARAFYLFPPGTIGKNGQLLSPRNPADIEAFRADSLERLYDLCARCKPRPRDPTLATSSFKDSSSTQRAVLPLKRSWQRLLRTKRPKTYSGTFIRASARMRTAFARAATTTYRLEVLRDALTRLLLDEEFIRLLGSEGVGSVPIAAYRPSHHSTQKAEQKFRDDLGEEALNLLSSGTLSRRTRALLEKLGDAWRLEAAELILLTNDPTDYFTRALVVATPPEGLLEQPRYRALGGRLQRLKVFRAEREYMLRQAKRTFATFDRDALDLTVVEAFARRLVGTPAITAWLEEHQREALHMLK